MNMRGAVEKGIQYIEANLQNDIGVSDVASAACYSQFYFSRQFSLCAHISVYDYILKRKLSEAYQKLFSQSPRIIDLALAYGFQSHEVFTRAFRKMFGENPSEASVYKPLLVYERIDDPYLAFLDGLKMDVVGADYPECDFEVESEADDAEGNAFLMVLSENRLRCRTVLEGQLGAAGAGQLLSFRLCGLKHVCRIHHNDVGCSIRYFVDNLLDPVPMTSNFVLLKKGKDSIDIIAPVP